MHEYIYKSWHIVDGQLVIKLHSFGVYLDELHEARQKVGDALGLAFGPVERDGAYVATIAVVPVPIEREVRV